jgi:adenine-specific DNA-methyltransferase
MARRPQNPRTVETLTHEQVRRKNIPTAEYQSVMQKEAQSPVRVAYERRNRDLDPQLVWRGKDEQDWSDLVVHAPPLYIQEKIHPKVLIDDLLKQTRERHEQEVGAQPDLFADFNGIPEGVDKTEFYQHEQNWSNRMILGDSLQVMASLAEREGLRGKVQCIYIDPPYGIGFNSNFQWSTTSNDVTDGKTEHITREPEQVKAFRDTWRNGIHSYLTYLRDRLTVARDLLSDRGSIFVQIGDENKHRVRVILDEVFGENNFVTEIAFSTTTGFETNYLSSIYNVLLWYAKSKRAAKFHGLYRDKVPGEPGATKYRQVSTFSALANSVIDPSEFVDLDQITSQDENASDDNDFLIDGKSYPCPKGLHWKTHTAGRTRLWRAHRVFVQGNTPRYLRKLTDSGNTIIPNIWTDIGGVQSRSDPKVYVVQTATEVIARAILMTTDPGDLVLDPTCGAGTTARVAEQWGRRWITIDTSRVALALARARIMGTRYPYYILADSRSGQMKEAEIKRSEPTGAPTYENIRHGFVYRRVPHIQLSDIANNAEIDVIWEKFQEMLDPLRQKLNESLGTKWAEWEIPRNTDGDWSQQAKQLHSQWWQKRLDRQREIDASIAAKAESDPKYLYDKPYEDANIVRVAGPFTVESLSPHRVLGVDENDELIDGIAESTDGYGEERGFVQMILEHLKTAGVQQAHKEDKITFTSLTPWPGDRVCAEGRYADGDAESGSEKRAAIFIGPEFGTVCRPDLVAAAREAGDADFDVLIACAFNYDAHSSEFDKLGRIPVLKARMNADLHMADDLKNTGKGNLFVIFGEPDIDILPVEGGKIQVKINGVDVFHPQTGEVRSDGAEGIACWFIDTDYNEESFFVRHAYFLGANDPYKSLKTTLKAEINEEAWATLYSDTSRPFDKPTSGRIAVKVINHLGDEVMKVFKVL